jgi:23S rRNA pseudouridine1911/1915/1917 synthase
MMSTREYKVAPSAAGQRIDAWLHARDTEISRSRWQALINAGAVLLDGASCKPSHKLCGAEVVTVDIPAPVATELQAENIPLDVLYEDEELLVIDKPAGLVVHPAAGHASGTLVNAILHHCGDSLKGVGGELRPGIVHRLDKDTSGVMVIAKTELAMARLSEQFKQRETEKEYAAIVWGSPQPARGRIETEIGRSRHDRKKMSVASPRGRVAISNYETAEELGPCTLLKLTIETGRTHQIRVHMAHIGHPVVGDATYGGKRERQSDLPAGRQMLHARRLVFSHPVSARRIESLAPIPADMRHLIETLRSNSR